VKIFSNFVFKGINADVPDLILGAPCIGYGLKGIGSLKVQQIMREKGAFNMGILDLTRRETR